MSDRVPRYMGLHESGELRIRIQKAGERLTACTLCPRRCGVDRTAGETGICKTGARAWISSYGPHFGEERPLVGANGSGAVFFTHCNLMCVFCQNFDISHEGDGVPVESERLASVMLELQHRGCHNINLVTPSHVVPQILSALELAIAGGLKIPLIYNSSGYDSVDTLRLLADVVDIYMPDFKFWDPEVARKTCDAPDYPDVARRALAEMHRQVGDLEIDDDGVARRGLLVRHLVMPQGMAGTPEVMRFLAETLSPRTYVNVMAQYRPCGDAEKVEALTGYPSRTEFEQAVAAAKAAGLVRLDRPRRVFMFA